MTFYIFQELDHDAGRHYWAAYRHGDRTGYLTLSVDSAERCESKARALLAGGTEPKLIKTCES
jgi:hypothetical protein